MKNTMIITKKESRHFQLNRFTKEELIHFVKDELLKFYTDKLADIGDYSNSEKEELINLLQDLAYGKYNQIINKLISDKTSNDILSELDPTAAVYDAKVVIEDDLNGCGNLKLNINLTPSWLEGLAI